MAERTRDATSHHRDGDGERRRNVCTHDVACFTYFRVPCKRRPSRNAVASVQVVPLPWGGEGTSCSQCLQASVQAEEGARSTELKQSLLRSAMRSRHRGPRWLEFLHHHFLLPVKAITAAPVPLVLHRTRASSPQAEGAGRPAPFILCALILRQRNCFISIYDFTCHQR